MRILLRLIGVLFVVLGVGILGIYGPGVISDAGTDRESLVEIPEADLVEGGCSRVMGLMVACAFTAKDPATEGEVRFRYLHPISTGSASALAMREPRSRRLTLPYGHAHFGGRVLTLLIALGMIVLGLAILIRKRRKP